MIFSATNDEGISNFRLNNDIKKVPKEAFIPYPSMSAEQYCPNI